MVGSSCKTVYQLTIMSPLPKRPEMEDGIYSIHKNSCIILFPFKVVDGTKGGTCCSRSIVSESHRFLKNS